MPHLINEQYRSNPRFNRDQVTQALPTFFQEEYPKLISFLEKYYEYTGEDSSVTINEKIQDVFDIRNISSTEIAHLDYLIGEISDGLETSSFYQSPRLMARLLTEMYRAKGTQISTEQFFKAFYGEDVEVSYPKKDIFILNDKPGGSLIGPQSLHYIQDDEKYQIFSVLLKTGMSLSDYEILYKKLIHPAGFYLAAETETQGLAQLGLMAGETTDPLEVANYAIGLQTTQLGTHMQPTFSLLVMEENDPVDARTQEERSQLRQVIRGDGTTTTFDMDFPIENRMYSNVTSLDITNQLRSVQDHTIDISNNQITFSTPVPLDECVIISAGEGIVISSSEVLSKYENTTLQQLADDFGTIANWTGVKPPTLDDDGLDLSQDYETLDSSDHT